MSKDELRAAMSDDLVERVGFIVYGPGPSLEQQQQLKIETAIAEVRKDYAKLEAQCAVCGMMAKFRFESIGVHTKWL